MEHSHISNNQYYCTQKCVFSNYSEKRRCHVIIFFVFDGLLILKIIQNLSFDLYVFGKKEEF